MLSSQEMDRIPEPEPDELEPGMTRVLTPEGWEEALYVEPEDTWELLADGTWLSPDGMTRSAPLVGPDIP